MSVSTLPLPVGIELGAADTFLGSERQGVYQLIDKLATDAVARGVKLKPYLAGDRTSIEQRQGSFTA